MSALQRFADDCQLSILSIVLNDPRLIDGLDLEANDFSDSECAELWQCLSAHRTNSLDAIAGACGVDTAAFAREIGQRCISAPSNLLRHVRGLRRAKQSMEYAQTVRAKLGRVKR